MTRGCYRKKGKPQHQEIEHSDHYSCAKCKWTERKMDRAVRKFYEKKALELLRNPLVFYRDVNA